MKNITQKPQKWLPLAGTMDKSECHPSKEEAAEKEVTFNDRPHSAVCVCSLADTV